MNPPFALPVPFRTIVENRRRPPKHQKGSISSTIQILVSVLIVVVAASATSEIATVCALRHRASAFAAYRFHAPRSFARGSASSSILRDAKMALSTAAGEEAETGGAATKDFEFPPNLRGFFGGSGAEGMSDPRVARQILDLLPPAKKNRLSSVRVLYLGTATYDLPVFRDRQTARLADAGCRVSSLDVASDPVDVPAAAAAIRDADVLLVGGGNTLYAVDRWERLGLVPRLRAAADRGCVLAGGSAGAICWFDAGHSDSADPETYRRAMLEKYGGGAEGPRDESSAFAPDVRKEWRYLKVPGMGFVTGPLVCCPHHDRVQSNGILRARDFDAMLTAGARARPGAVLGVGIDHYAAFVVEGERYRVYVLPEKAGSVSDTGDGFDVDEDGTARGTPGVWIKRVVTRAADKEDGEDLVVEAMVCPAEGKLVDLLTYGGCNLSDRCHVTEENDTNEQAIAVCRRENPSGILL